MLAETVAHRLGAEASTGAVALERDDVSTRLSDAVERFDEVPFQMLPVPSARLRRQRAPRGHKCVSEWH